ncbi:MAG: porin family protein [Ginsengibacter sp.]
MKTKLISVAILFFISSSLFAQTFKLGIKGGANLGKISGSSFKDQFTLGYHAGGFATIGLGDKFAIQPEVLFNQVNNDTATSFSEIFKVRNADQIQLKFLSIPVLLNYNVNRFITLQAGPQFGILLNKNDNFLQNGNNAFKSGDFSLVGGVQLNLLKFRVYGRFVGGQTDIDNLSSNEAWKTKAIQLGVGFAL